MEHPKYSSALLSFFNKTMDLPKVDIEVTEVDPLKGASQLYDGEQMVFNTILDENGNIESVLTKVSGGVAVIGIANWCASWMVGKSIDEALNNAKMNCLESLFLQPVQWYAVEMMIEALQDLKNRKPFL